MSGLPIEKRQAEPEITHKKNFCSDSVRNWDQNMIFLSSR